MRNLIFAIMAGVLMAQWPLSVHAEEKLPRHTLNEEASEVYYTPSLPVAFRLMVLGGSGKDYAHLTITARNDGATLRAQSDALAATYPGYTVHRAMYEADQGILVEVPSIGLKLEPRVMNDFNYGAFFEVSSLLTQRQTAQLQADFRSRPSEVLKITGNLEYRSSVVKTSKTYSLKVGVCRKFARGAKDLNDALDLSADVIDDASFGAPASAVPHFLLLKEILKKCLEVDSAREIRSYADVLSLQVRPTGYTGGITVRSSVRESKAATAPVKTLEPELISVEAE